MYLCNCPSGARDLSLFRKTCRPTMGITPRPNNWIPGAYSPGVNRPERGGDQKTPSSAEVKNEWSCTSTSTLNFRDLRWDDFTYTIYSIHIVTCVTLDMSDSIYSPYLDSKNSKYVYKIQYNIKHCHNTNINYNI
jgi:hypothetical protein